MRHVVILAFDAVQILDVTGPAAAFGAASDACPEPAYAVTVASAHGGEVRSNCGVRLCAIAVGDIDPATVDLLLIAGGDDVGLRALIADGPARAWTERAIAAAPRYGSICSGAFVLAAWGMLDGRKVATHWRATAELARRFPRLTVDADALYVEDGPVWTSAGITTGIDMSLAIVERDHGAALATAVARRLVLHARRPGHQSQFSALLEAQAAAASGGYAGLIAWMGENLDAPLDVEALAARASQSPRSFHRNFRAATGKGPAAFVTTLRLDCARTLIEAGQPLKRVAVASGFGSPDRLARAFSKAFGLGPAAYAAAAVRKRG